MNNCSILVADDEAPLREFLLDLIEKLWPEVGQVHQAVNGVDALKKIIQHKPDVAFLDINMPGMSGIEVAAQCADDCHVVFVTAYDQFAIEAFENNAVDYLLKPVSEQRLQQTLARLENRMQSHPASLESVIEQLSKEKRNLNWLKVAHKEQIKLIKTEEVDFFQSADKYTSAYSDGAEYILRTSLKQLEQQLDPEKFWRIHRSTIVRVDAIEGIEKLLSGQLLVKIGKRQLPVSRAYQGVFKQD